MIRFIEFTLLRYLFSSDDISWTIMKNAKMFTLNLGLSVNWSVIAVIILAFKGSGAHRIFRAIDPNDFKCPDPNGGFYPHKYCERYYECRTHLILFQCPKGELFNEDIGVCYKERFTDCNGRQKPSDEDDRSLDDFSNDLSLQCPSTEGLFPHKTRCDLYYQCSTTATVHHCSFNHYFNVHLRSCFHKNWTPCSDPMKPTEEATTVFMLSDDRDIKKFPVDVDFVCPSKDRYQPHVKYCELYYECNENGTTLNKCPEDMLFNKAVGLCFNAFVTPCENRLKPEDKEDDVTTSNPTTFSDAFTIVFSKETSREISEVKSTTSEPSSVAVPQSTEESTEEPTDSTIVLPVTPAPDFTTTTVQVTTHSDEDDEISCPSRFGLYPHPKYPSKFIQCSHYTPYVMDCPETLVFNNKLQVCDYTTGE